jgi:hypothetical protein
MPEGYLNPKVKEKVLRNFATEIGTIFTEYKRGKANKIDIDKKGKLSFRYINPTRALLIRITPGQTHFFGRKIKTQIAIPLTIEVLDSQITGRLKTFKRLGTVRNTNDFKLPIEKIQENIKKIGRVYNLDIEEVTETIKVWKDDDKKRKKNKTHKLGFKFSINLEAEIAYFEGFQFLFINNGRWVIVPEAEYEEVLNQAIMTRAENLKDFIHGFLQLYIR